MPQEESEKPAKAYLFLSSGARPRYLEDVFRVLALPEGGQIRFRYSAELLSADARKSVLSALGRPVYLAYVDTAVSGAPIAFVPVRRAIVEAARSEGTSFFFKLTVKEFVRPSATEFLESTSNDKTPAWGNKSETGEYPLDGYWVNELESDLSEEMLAPASDMAAFEATVNCLLRHADFSPPNNRFFYHVLGLRKLSRSNEPIGDFLTIESGRWKLDAFKRYQLDLYHYFPETDIVAHRPTHWLVVNTTKIGAMVDGPAMQKADSEYDVKEFRLRSSNRSVGAHDTVEIHSTTSPGEDFNASAKIGISIYAGPSIIVVSVQIVVVGLLLALPAIISGLPDGWIWTDLLTAKNFVSLIPALGASAFAILGLKKAL